MKPVVTIGVCLKNCEASIKEVINTLLDQDFPHKRMEVIFVDDGSEDKTLSLVLDSVSRMDMQVKVYHQEWKGLGTARNMVVDNASGEYILWVDGDMILSKDYVRKLVKLMEQNPTVGVAKGAIEIKSTENLVDTLEIMGIVTSDFKNQERASQKLPGTAGSICRVKAIRQIGGFDDRIKRAGEDIDVAYRIREVGWQICFTGEAKYFAKCKRTWKALWRRYFIHGYGLHYLLHKNDGVEKLYEMVPPAAFLSGLLRSFTAYRLIGKKVAFLLPLHFIFKMTAWCFGFTESHIHGYGHIFKK